MCRLYFLTFWGDFKGWTVGRPSLLAKQELKAAAPSHDHEEGEPSHAQEDLSQPGYPPHESPWQMTVPLIILAAFSLLAGILNPGFGIVKEKPMEHWLEPVFKAATEGAVLFRHDNDQSWAEGMEGKVAMGGIAAFAIGTGLAWWVYKTNKGEPAKRLAAAQPALYQLVLDKWRVDELYDATVIAAVGWFLTVPHANATVADAGNEDYVLTAAPGVGYAYRWDSDGDGRPDKEDFGDDTTLKLHVEPGKSVRVKLEVKNAFGMVRTKTLEVARPQPQTSSL